MNILIYKNDVNLQQIDIYSYVKVENVLTYSCNDWSSENPYWNVITKDEESNLNTKFYLVFDSLYHDAFAHWFFESLIYLPMFKLLRDQYPELKLLLTSEKTYKNLFLNFFDISVDEIDYSLDNNFNNVCFFLEPVSSLNDKIKSEKWENQVIKLINLIHDYVPKKLESTHFLIMPRQIKENYPNNDRVYNLEPIINLLNTNEVQYTFLNTDEITDIKNQIDTLNSSENIILTDGSPVLVNSFLTKNKNIFVIDSTMTIEQSHLYVKYKFLLDKILEFNNLRYIKFNEIISFL